MGGLLAGLDALVVALGLLGALFVVSAVLRPLLVAVLGQAPFIGGWLASNVDSGLRRFQAAITGPANAAMPILADALNWIVDQGAGLVARMGSGISEASAALWRTINLHLPLQLQQTLATAWTYTQEAEAYALSLEQAGQADLRGLVALAESDARGLVEAARAESASGISAAESVVLAEIRKAEQAAAQLFLQAESDARLAAAQAEQTATQLVDQVKAEARAGIAAAEHDIAALGRAVGVAVSDSAAILGGDIAAAEARVQQALGGVESSLQKEIDKVIHSGPWAALVAAYEGGEAALAADVETLVKLALAEVRAQMAQAATLRAKYAGVIAARVDQIRGAG